MKLTVIGGGYVGLVTAACFADIGHDVICVEADATKLAQLAAGEVTFFEPGIEGIVKRTLANGKLTFQAAFDDRCAGSAVVLVCVGTPSAADGTADISQLNAAVDAVGSSITHNVVVAVKSTVPVGTCAGLQERLDKTTGRRLMVVSNPEFLSEGRALRDFLSPHRVVIGTTSTEAAETLRILYAPFTRTDDRTFITDPNSAEMIKLASNAFLATRISFINHIAALCEKTGADAEAVRLGMGLDERIGKHYLFPGAGFGGACFPKDLRALAAIMTKFHIESDLIDGVLAVNERQKRWLGSAISKHFGSDLRGRKVAIWGLSFKPNTDDIREAPALVLIEQLLGAGATVSVFDPAAMQNVRKMFGDRISYSEDQYAAAADADGLAIVTEWLQFRSPDLLKLKAAMKTAVIFDGRNVLQPSVVSAAGFEYYGVGRRPAAALEANVG